MIEAALFVIIASGLWVVANQFTHRKHPTLPIPEDHDRRSISVVAEGGLYHLAPPTDAPIQRAFRDLHLIEGGLRLQDNHTQQIHIINFATIQWVSAITFTDTGIATISLHLEINRQWRILTFQIPESDMIGLVQVLPCK